MEQLKKELVVLNNKIKHYLCNGTGIGYPKRSDISVLSSSLNRGLGAKSNRSGLKYHYSIQQALAHQQTNTADSRIRSKHKMKDKDKEKEKERDKEKDKDKDKSEEEAEERPSNRWNRRLPNRLHFYILSKLFYDCLFKNVDELRDLSKWCTPANRSQIRSEHELTFSQFFGHCMNIYRLFYHITDETFDRIIERSGALSVDSIPFKVVQMDHWDSEQKDKESSNSLEQEFASYLRNHQLYAHNSLLTRMGRYSSILCERAYGFALQVYETDLPQLYSSKVHSSHAKKALRVFESHAFGPMSAEYRNRLINETEKIWKSNRQACDAVSLTGRMCCRAFHDNSSVVNISVIEINQTALLNEEKAQRYGTDDDGHFSGFSSLHACGCGRTIRRREDPFNLLDANHNFFQCKCCVESSHCQYTLLARMGGTGNASNDTGHNSKEMKTDAETSTNPTETKSHLKDASGTVSDNSHAEQKKNTRESAEDQSCRKVMIGANGIPIVSYYGGFGLHILGGSEMYHKISGVNQTGFQKKIVLHLCIFISCVVCSLPLLHYHHHNLIAQASGINESFSGNTESDLETGDENIAVWIRRLRKTAQMNSEHPNRDSYVPCFVGLEYECYRGHRFILNYSSVLLFAHDNGVWAEHLQNKQTTEEDLLEQLNLPKVTKETRFIGNEFPPCDLPLRYPCKFRFCFYFVLCTLSLCYNCNFENRNCRADGISSAKGAINSQLQRVFVVTPPSPISIVCNPVIKSQNADATFSLDAPVTLPSSQFLVFRLPYIYYFEKRGLPPDKLRLSRGLLQSSVKTGIISDHNNTNTEQSELHEHTDTANTSKNKPKNVSLTSASAVISNPPTRPKEDRRYRRRRPRRIDDNTERDNIGGGLSTGTVKFRIADKKKDKLNIQIMTKESQTK
ncbi:hypothetical protein RFI_13913 [Reticulomyxa filosa]|uniref:Nonsense-mediated mRNA decay factor SMG8 n=1 Tax=Reticulomyxa filosa TaxID=46433 RepID=X6NBV4_RETFI|nr:hypothetical protein RFI_13913 [Reticulomyxa filosa]|eukprot:ETO23264.1 hypothetical protein RFI_13913 [Reticulomyxa filosa]